MKSHWSDRWLNLSFWAVLASMVVILCGCQTNYPKIERPVKFWNADPAGAMACLKDGETETCRAIELLPGEYVKVPRCRLKDDNTEECEPILESDQCQTADDHGVVQKYVVTLINQCQKWRPRQD